MPFYAFGPLKIVPVRQIGSLGSAEGPPTMVDCPLGDSLRSVYPWLLLFALLLRPVNRNRRAWAILLPLLAIYGLLHVVENGIDGPMTWYISIYVRSFVCEALRALAVGVALLLTVSDLIRVRRHWVRRLVSLAIVLVGGMGAIRLNAPLAANAALLTVAFAAIVLVCAIGLKIVATLVRWLLGRSDLRWHAGIYLALCVGPLLIVAGTRLFTDAHTKLSMIHQIIMATIAAQILLAPYLVFFCFALLALLSPLYRQRLTACLAKDAPRPYLTTNTEEAIS